MAQRKPSPVVAWIDLERCPGLRLLRWNIAASRITRRDAFAIWWSRLTGA